MSLRKGDHVPDRILARQEHHDPVEAEGDPAVRRGAVLQRLQEKAKPVLRLLPADFENVENPLLDLSVVDPDRSAADLVSVQDDIIGVRPGLLRRSFQERDIFRLGRGKRMMDGGQPFFFVVVIEHRKIGYPDKVPPRFVDEP